jgi:hypothetical protein
MLSIHVVIITDVSQHSYAPLANIPAPAASMRSSPVIHATPYQEVIIISSNEESDCPDQTNISLADVIIISSDKSSDSADQSDNNANHWSDESDADDNDVSSFDNAKYPVHARHRFVTTFLHDFWSRCCMLSRPNTIPTAADHPPVTTTLRAMVNLVAALMKTSTATNPSSM